MVVAVVVVPVFTVVIAFIVVPNDENDEMDCLLVPIQSLDPPWLSLVTEGDDTMPVNLAILCNRVPVDVIEVGEVDTGAADRADTDPSGLVLGIKDPMLRRLPDESLASLLATLPSRREAVLVLEVVCIVTRTL